MEIEITKLANGDLEITMDEESREELAEAMQGTRGYWSVMADLFEPYFTNGSYEPFDAGDGNPFVGLTSAPCIAECMDVEDDGTRIIVGDFWYFERYMLDDPLEELATEGRTVFQLAR